MSTCNIILSLYIVIFRLFTLVVSFVESPGVKYVEVVPESRTARLERHRVDTRQRGYFSTPTRSFQNRLEASSSRGPAESADWPGEAVNHYPSPPVRVQSVLEGAGLREEVLTGTDRDLHGDRTFQNVEVDQFV